MSELTEQEAFSSSRNPSAEQKKEEVIENVTSEVATEEQVATTAEPEKPAESKFDPDAFRSEIRKEFEDRERKLFGHIGGLTRQMKEMANELVVAKAAAKKVEDAPSQTAITEASKDPAKWANLKRDWPDWADAVDEKLKAELSNIKPQTVDAQKIISDAELAYENKQREKAAARLERDFPDWRSPEKYQALRDWMETQPDHVKELGASDWIDDARQLLKLFADSQKPVEEPKPQAKDINRQKRIEAAVTPKGSGGHASTAQTEHDAFVNARRR